MAFTGMDVGQRMQWLKDGKTGLPSIAVLFAVTVFWIIGTVGGIGFLARASSPMIMLAGIYAMLGAVAVSIVVATLAVNDLVGRCSWSFPRR